jgi:hypothetical protein
MDEPKNELASYLEHLAAHVRSGHIHAVFSVAIVTTDRAKLYLSILSIEKG